jgi:DNA-binding transcriptional regulator GbsR (MarR family)
VADTLETTLEIQTFKEIAENFLDEINHQLEEENINPAIKTQVEDIWEMLDAIVEYL